MNLYEINTQIDALTEELIDPETGEIDEAIEAELDQLDMELERKIEYLALKVKNLRADATAYKTEKEAFAKKEKSASNKADRIEAYIANNMRGRTLKTSKVSISWKRSKRVEIIDLGLIPDEYIKTEVSTKPVKSLISKAIKEGKEVPGAYIAERDNLQLT